MPPFFFLVVERDAGHLIWDQVMCCNAFVCTSHYMLGIATIALGVAGFAPLTCNLSVLVKVQAASSLFSLRAQAHADS